MAQNVTLYNLLISCPGDIKKEVTLIEAAVDEFNELYAETLGITIKTRHWSKSSYAQSGGKPQALLNEQFVNKCDAAVAIFWTRFGSPTDEYGSGTEEEIEIMLQSGKQVFMYFSDKPIPPSKINGDGYEKIQAFRDKYKDKGIYFTYSSDEEFKKMFFAHLSMHFLAEKRVSETANEYRSELKLLGIDETGRLTEEAVVCPFVLNAEITMKEYITSIKKMYQEISDMNVGGRSVTANTFFAGFTSPVDIDEDEKEFITAAAEQLECELSDSFFELGNLNKDTLTSNPLSGPKLNGTSEEKQKYWKIKRLHETISNVLVIGGSGSGKTRFFVKPNLMQCVSKDYPTSFVITDPKGSLIGEVGQLLIRSGYRVKVLNTINFSKSMKYNPFRYLHSEKDVLKLVNTLICNTKGEGEKSAEDFWVKSERLFYTALIGYIWQEAPEEEMNFTTLLEMINASEAREDDPEFQSPVDMMFERLEERDPDHFAVRQYKKFLLSAGDICSK